MSKVAVLCMTCKHFDATKGSTKGYGLCNYNEKEMSQWCMCGLHWEQRK